MQSILTSAVYQNLLLVLGIDQALQFNHALAMQRYQEMEECRNSERFNREIYAAFVSPPEPALISQGPASASVSELSPFNLRKPRHLRALVKTPILKKLDEYTENKT